MMHAPGLSTVPVGLSDRGRSDMDSTGFSSQWATFVMTIVVFSTTAKFDPSINSYIWAVKAPVGGKRKTSNTGQQRDRMGS